MNDGMGEYLAFQLAKTMIQKVIKIKEGEFLVLGINF